MKHLPTAIILITTWASCVMDFTATAVIENDSGNNIEVTIFYNRHFLDSTAYRNDSNRVKNFLKNTGDISSLAYKMDTINTKLTFTLNNGQKLTISHVPGGRTVKPEYGEIDSISILSGKNLITQPNKHMEQLFKEKEAGYWVWNIY